MKDKLFWHLGNLTNYSKICNIAKCWDNRFNLFRPASYIEISRVFPYIKFRRKALLLVCFTLKEIIRYYINHDSLMYVSFLDPSQAFDRVNHIVLLRKLLSAGLPMYLLRLITFWYCYKFYHIGREYFYLLVLLFLTVLYSEECSILYSEPSGCCFAGVVINYKSSQADDLIRSVWTFCWGSSDIVWFVLNIW